MSTSHKSLVVVREYSDHSGIADVTLCTSYDQVKFIERLSGGAGLIVRTYEPQETDSDFASTIEITSDGAPANG